MDVLSGTLTTSLDLAVVAVVDWHSIDISDHL